MLYLFLKRLIQPFGCRKVFHIMLFGKLKGFFFDQRPTNGYFLGTNDVEPFHLASSRTERKVAFNDFIFDDFSPHSTDAFAISAHCLTIVANVDVEISRRSAKAFCGPTFLSNSRKMLSFSLNEKQFCFRQSAMLHDVSKIKCSAKLSVQYTPLLCIVE
ncbi:hypothetical protein AVEN_134953-1 [Araneus ventricosus]|uniref:Uncharacterized protein n=1 Tax=Araneus ventricosus TaxID=182803 RepID=A0A4Y2CIG5_ARAVE|nr:hypothetical protein AVEN_134953-1 [Araneus ventricosus]